MNLEKFEAFFKLYSLTKKKLAESVANSKRLAEENVLLRCVETHLMQQLTHTQENNLFMQKALTEFSGLRDKAKSQKNGIVEQEKTILELSLVVNAVKDEVKNKIIVATDMAELEKKLHDTEQLLLRQDGKYNLLRMENQVLLRDKESALKQIEENSNINEKIKLEYNMLKNELDRVHLMHNKQIMDYQNTIKTYEKTLNEITHDISSNKEEGSNSETYQQKKEQISKWNNKNSVTWVDAARRAALDNNVCETSEKDLETSNEKTNPESSQAITKFKPKVRVSRVTPTVINGVRSQASGAITTPLEIYSVKDVTNQPKKKKLYSNNSNHFIL